MPPKKAVKEDKILLGRPGNNLKSGIVCRGTSHPLIKCKATDHAEIGGPG